MSASTTCHQQIRAGRGGDRRRRHCSSHLGFSLTELLVVIGIIVLLIGLLLTALAAVRKRSDRTKTESTMQQFANACVAFQAEHGRYPGILPDEVLAANPLISSTENALLELMGGVRLLAPSDVGTAYETEYNNWSTTGNDPQTTTEISYPYGTVVWKIKVNIAKIGEGPVIDGKSYPPYFTPSADQLVAVVGQVGEPHSAIGGGSISIPDLVDAWNQPILYIRQQRPRGPLVAAYNAANKSQFLREPLRPYIESTSLGESARDQSQLSILSSAPDEFATLARVLAHPTVENAARGAFCLISSGPDGVYFSRDDGPGSQSTPIDDIVNNPNTEYNNITIVEKYDDVRVFGGG